MKRFHERLARTGLLTIEKYGFVLAGGYALSAHGFGDRPSMDVDLFTKDMSVTNFAQAVEELIAGLEGDGLLVSVITRADLFLNVNIAEPETGESSELQLGCDYREFPSVRLDIGPVLHEHDAVANKMTALFSRGEVRDFIDIDLVVTSGRFSREEVLALADTRESLPLDRRMLIDRFKMPSSAADLGKYGARQFAKYGVDEAARTQIIARFAEWAAEIDPGPSRLLLATVPEKLSSGTSPGRPPKRDPDQITTKDTKRKYN